MNDTQTSSQQPHLADPAMVFQDEEVTIRLTTEDSSTNTTLRSLSQHLGSSSLLQKGQTTAMTKQTNCSSSAECQSTNIQGTMRAGQSSIFWGGKKCPTKRQKSMCVFLVPGSSQKSLHITHTAVLAQCHKFRKSCDSADPHHPQRQGSQVPLLSI